MTAPTADPLGAWAARPGDPPTVVDAAVAELRADRARAQRYAASPDLPDTMRALLARQADLTAARIALLNPATRKD